MTSHRSTALKALDDIDRAVANLRGRLAEPDAAEADRLERAAAAVEVSRSLRRRCDDLWFSVASEALESGVPPGLLTGRPSSNWEERLRARSLTSTTRSEASKHSAHLEPHGF